MPKILQITDMHIQPKPGDTLLGIDTEKYFKLAIDHAHENHGPIDLMLLTGDLAQTPNLASYTRLQQILLNRPTPSYCLPGNHDDIPLMEQCLNTAQISCQKTIALESWSIICLNSQKPGSPAGTLAQDQLDFLRDQLETQPDVNKLIALHHHCVPCQSEWLDTMVVDNYLEFLELVKPYKQVKAIVFGHIHQAFEKQHQGLSLYGTPSTCFQFKPEQKDFFLDDKPPGYRIIDLSADGTLSTTVSWLPVTLDELERNCQGY